MDTGWLSRNRSALIAAAAVVPFLVSALLSLFRDSIAPTTSVLVLVLVVVAAAATGDRTAGVVAAVSSGAWFDFFLTQPYSQFAIKESADLEATVLLVVVGLGVTELALWGRRQQAHASRSAGYLDGVIGTSELVSGEQTPPQELTRHVARQIVEVLGIDTCRFVPAPVPGPRRPSSTTTDRSSVAVTAWTSPAGGVPHRRGGGTPRPPRGRRPRALRADRRQPDRPADAGEQLRVAVLLADQVGTALTSRSG